MAVYEPEVVSKYSARGQHHSFSSRSCSTSNFIKSFHSIQCCWSRCSTTGVVGGTCGLMLSWLLYRIGRMAGSQNIGCSRYWIASNLLPPRSWTACLCGSCVMDRSSVQQDSGRPRQLVIQYVPSADAVEARICPVPKTIGLAHPSDFRPISVTDVLSRITEKMLVRDFLYPALGSPPPTLCFTDQYDFRPSGSTTAALVALLHCVTQALETNPYVVIVALFRLQQGVRHRAL